MIHSDLMENEQRLPMPLLEPAPDESVIENGQLIQSKPYYLAYTNIETLALLDESKGSNWLQWRKR